MIFINSDGWILIGPSLYQLLAPLIIGVKLDSGRINSPTNDKFPIMYIIQTYFLSVYGDMNIKAMAKIKPST